MPTPSGSASSLATPKDLLARFDARLVGDLVSDTGARVDATTLLTDANALAALDDAWGELESAVFAGGRYGAPDLAALTGTAKKWAVTIVCRLAMWGLLLRRKPELALPEWAKQAYDTLGALRRGEWIFALQEVQDAGLSEKLDDAGTPAGQPLVLPSSWGGRYYGTRQKYLPQTG